jgi:hypothetical protein
MGAIEYNIGSAEDLGWTPEWFGASDFNDDLTEKIKSFQRENGLSADGKCGQGTFRVIYTERISDMDDDEPSSSGGNRSLIYRGNEIHIEWDKVTRWIDEDGLKLSKYPSLDADRDIKMFVTHWDVCLNSKSCVNVLNKRGLSIHFCIDNDGTIHQLADIATVCYHAGSKLWNSKTIGVEVSNAFYTKYQKNYVKAGFGERPVCKNSMVHGRKVDEHTDFYPVQIEALKALYKAIHEGVGIPLETPLDSNGNTTYKVSKEAKDCNFEGFVSHYHLTERKMDCCNLDIESMLKEIR